MKEEIQKAAKVLRDRLPSSSFTQESYSGNSVYVNKEMGTTEKKFLFYCCCNSADTPAKFSFTSTHLYFLGMGSHLVRGKQVDESTIKPIGTWEQGVNWLGKILRASGITYPIFRIDMQGLLEIKIEDVGSYALMGPNHVYNLNFKYFNKSEIVTCIWNKNQENQYFTIFSTLTDIVCRFNIRKVAKDREEALDYETAISLWENIGETQKARETREKMMDSKASKTVVHGDYIDDRDTIVKDSVVNKSNIGAGGKSKAEEIKEIKELHDAGAIDDAEFKQMKKEILGK